MVGSRAFLGTRQFARTSRPICHFSLTSLVLANSSLKPCISRQARRLASECSLSTWFHANLLLEAIFVIFLYCDLNCGEDLNIKESYPIEKASSLLLFFLHSRFQLGLVLPSVNFCFEKFKNLKWLTGQADCGFRIWICNTFGILMYILSDFFPPNPDLHSCVRCHILPLYLYSKSL